MRIEVCSRAMALRAAAEADEKISIVSITSKEEPDVIFPDNPNIVSILHLHFNDLSREYDEEGLPYGRPLPSQKDFDGLKMFLDCLSCERLIVHCHEGRSRSAAAAQAVGEYLGCEEEICFPDEGISPNPLVYELARRELERSFS